MFSGRSKPVPLFPHFSDETVMNKIEVGITQECISLIIYVQVFPRNYVAPWSYDLRK